MVYFLYLPHPIKAHACGLELHHLPSYLCFRQSAGNRSVSRYICLSDWVAASSDSPPVCRHSAYGTSVSEPRIKRWRWVLERSRHQMFEQSNSFFFTTYIKYWRDEIGVLSKKKKKKTDVISNCLKITWKQLVLGWTNKLPCTVSGIKDVNDSPCELKMPLGFTM